MQPADSSLTKSVQERKKRIWEVQALDLPLGVWGL